MPKKAKRHATKAQESKASAPQVMETAAARPAGPRSYRSSEQEFNPDYSDIRTDLRRIGLIGGGLILAMVILSIFI
jgi:hypothetical protein